MRKTVHIIYPSSIVPTCYSSSFAFYKVTDAFICAYSVFNFYTKTTTKDSSKCPLPQYEELAHKYRDSISKRKAKETNILFNSAIFVLTETEKRTKNSVAKRIKKLFRKRRKNANK